MVNVWNAYNCLITYAWSRAASLVYNGERNGLGFRDTVQDILAVLPCIPEEAGKRLELMLSGQFSNGGALPVVKPFEHKPGKTPVIPDGEFRSDDCLWFFNTVPAYVEETGDYGFYSKVIPYADKGEATVFGHLKRALEFNLERTGAHGLPCGLKADWNDCLRLGYRGESLFVAFQVRLGLSVYAEIAESLGEKAEQSWHSNSVRISMPASRNSAGARTGLSGPSDRTEHSMAPMNPRKVRSTSILRYGPSSAALRPPIRPEPAWTPSSAN